MCGIVGAIAQRQIESILLTGLQRLEYRGYDSAGIAVVDQHGQWQRQRVQGKVAQLQDCLHQQPCQGNVGIAHTRWATHGKPSSTNAHPHLSGDFAIVHNGIVENYQTLREQLTQQGYQFNSETDSEIIVHLLHAHYTQCQDTLTALRNTSAQLQGAYALGVIHRQQPDRLFAVRRGSPLVIGVGIGEHFIASDSLALLPVTRQFIYLEDGDIAEIDCQQAVIYAADGTIVKRPQYESNVQHEASDKGPYRHYMQKEIHEQSRAIADTLEGRLLAEHIDPTFISGNTALLDSVNRLQLVACGTSYHAALVGRYWLEAIARIPCRVELASEIRYRNPVVQDNTLFVTLSQSGETADTLAALHDAKKTGYCASLSICNVPESSLVRESDMALMTHAGPEIGVASTKAFTTQLTALLLLTGIFTKRQAQFSQQQLVNQLRQLPQIIDQVLQLEPQIIQLAERFAQKEHTLFLGRGALYPIAMEGALKLKEISYIHAEAYAAGELKHGPLALIDENMPVIAIAPNDHLLAKINANLQEVRARGGQLIVFSDHHDGNLNSDCVTIIPMPKVDAPLAPIVYTVPLQLLAYHVAVLKGTDVDQPRNLAKSVTVE